MEGLAGCLEWVDGWLVVQEMNVVLVGCRGSLWLIHLNLTLLPRCRQQWSGRKPRRAAAWTQRLQRGRWRSGGCGSGGGCVRTGLCLSQIKVPGW